MTTEGSDGQPESVFRVGTPLNICIEWEGETDYREVYAGYRIDGPRLQAITGFEGWEVGAFMDCGGPLNGSGRVVFSIPAIHLGEGKYSICVSINRRLIPNSPDSVLHYVDKACAFDVVRENEWHFSYLYEPPVTCTILDAQGHVDYSCGVR